MLSRKGEIKYAHDHKPPTPLNPLHRGTLNVRTEKPELLLVLSPIRGEIEKGLVLFQQLLVKERNIYILYILSNENCREPMESLIDQILFLQRVPIFKDLTVEQLGEIASISEINEYEEDEFLFREGDVGYNAYILISGKVELFKTLKNRDKVIIAEMTSGDYFGEMAIFDGETRTASAKLWSIL